MNNIIVLLFAALDSKAWGIEEAMPTIDRLVSAAASPRGWVLDLCTCKTDDDCLAVLRTAMQEFGVLLPGSVGDLMAGFVLYRFDKREISTENARHYLVDIVDAYGTSCVDAETAAELDLNDAIYKNFREMAVQALEYLSGIELLPADRRLVDSAW